MRPGDLDHMPAAPRYTPEQSVFLGIKQRLNGVAVQTTGDKVYINGEAFSLKHFQFMIQCLEMPKDPKEKKK